MQTTHSVLSASNLSIGYHSGNNAVTVMQGINLQLHSGRLTAMLGRNGIGKSTLLRTIAGAQPSLNGTVLLDGRNINEYSPRELSRQMSLVYTDRTQAGGLTVKQLVSLGRYPHTGFFGRLGRHDRDVVAQSMTAAGIKHKETEYVAELSDGERQKAMIARALAQETPIILLDEPTSFLDVASRIEVMMLLHQLARNEHKAVLLSTHDITQALSLADELWVMAHNHTILQGCTEDCILSGAIQEMFPHNVHDGITFDPAIGDFEITLQATHGYSLHCSNSTLHRWIANALRRNGIASSGNEGTITANSPTDITLSTQNTTTHFTSIAALLDAIR